jgi:hypothetical protein
MAKKDPNVFFHKTFKSCPIIMKFILDVKKSLPAIPKRNLRAIGFAGVFFSIRLGSATFRPQNFRQEWSF